MQSPEIRLQNALQEIEKAIKQSGDLHAKFDAFVSITKVLPLTHLESWEYLVRNEIQSNVSAREGIQVLAWLHICSADGYLRSSAMRAISQGAPSALLFAFLLRRLNDWVPIVRTVARSVIPKIGLMSSAQYVADTLFAMLPNWSEWGRIEEADRSVMLELANIPEVAALIRARMISSKFGPMPKLLSQFGRASAFDVLLAEIALNASQPALRAKAYRTILEARMIWFEGRVWVDRRIHRNRTKPKFGSRPLTVEYSLSDMLSRASSDSSVIVRKVAVDVLVREFEKPNFQYTDLAKKLAADKSKAVAVRAQFVLDRL
jgi:hypothetical protein